MTSCQWPHRRPRARPEGAPDLDRRVEGDIIHKTIAIESGAHFEGSVQRQDDPLSTSGAGSKTPASALASRPATTPPSQPAATAKS